MSVEWEVEIKVRRNGRLVRKEVALGETPAAALWFAHTDVGRWAEEHPETKEHES